MRVNLWLAGATFAFGAMGLTMAGSAAAAQEDVLTACGRHYQQAKAANALGARTWSEFLAECRARMAQTPQPDAQPGAMVVAASDKSDKKAAGSNETPSVKQEEKKTEAEPKSSSAAVFPSKVDPKYANEKPGKQRQKTCGDQFKANKATNANGGLKWIEKGGGYWSQCNKRLKGA